LIIDAILNDLSEVKIHEKSESKHDSNEIKLYVFYEILILNL